MTSIGKGGAVMTIATVPQYDYDQMPVRGEHAVVIICRFNELEALVQHVFDAVRNPFTCCSMETGVLVSTDGLWGPVIANMFGVS
jgi:hypothetical protein